MIPLTAETPAIFQKLHGPLSAVGTHLHVCVCVHVSCIYIGLLEPLFSCSRGFSLPPDWSGPDLANYIDIRCQLSILLDVVLNALCVAC